MTQPQVVPLAPEAIPDIDQAPPTIEPNLADNKELVEKVMKHVTDNFFYPYLLMQQRFYPIWKLIDEAWRARTNRNDLDHSIFSDADAAQKKAGDGRGRGMVDTKDGFSAKVTPSAIHKQIDAITNMAVAISFEDGAPVKFLKPDNFFEHPLYNPTQQAVDTANDLLVRNSEEVRLKQGYRMAFNQFKKYGHAFAMSDLERSFRDEEVRYGLSPDPRAAQMELQVLSQKHGSQPVITTDIQSRRATATFRQRTVDRLYTNFTPIDVRDVFIDLLIPCYPIENQPCPMVRSHITKWNLFDNKYDEQKNQFGWLNIGDAIAENRNGAFVLSRWDEKPWMEQLQKRYQVGNVQYLQRDNSIEQLWTAFPMLSIDPATMEFDDGNGVKCQQCEGAASGCEGCGGSGKQTIIPQRYILQMFGSMYKGNGLVCLRLQKNPTAIPGKDRLPLLFAKDIVEDTADAYGVSKTELAFNAHEQLATAYNQWFDAKNQGINRPWKVKEGSPSQGKDLNAPNGQIIFENSPAEVEPMQMASFDITQNILPMIDKCEQEVTSIFGANDAILGNVSSGRRAAAEIIQVADAAKTPIVVSIDSFNHQMMGPWAMSVADNVEAWGNRQWIYEKTGRATWGKLRVQTAVADEWIKKVAMQQNLRYIVQMIPSLPPGAVNLSQALKLLFRSMGIKETDQLVSDGGMEKERGDAMRIVSQILGEAKALPPTQDDPHELYLAIFAQAMKDPYWMEKAPENMSLLMQRMQLQQMLLLQQQLQQMHAMAGQQQQQAMSSPEVEAQPSAPGAPPSTPDAGTAIKQAQG